MKILPTVLLSTLLISSVPQIHTVTSEEAYFGTALCAGVGGFIGGLIGSTDRYNSSSVVWGAGIGATLFGLIGGIHFYDKTPRRRFERAQDLIARNKSYAIFRLIEENQEKDAVLIEKMCDIYVSHDFPIVRAVICLEEMNGNYNEAIKLLSLAKRDLAIDNYFVDSCNTWIGYCSKFITYIQRGFKLLKALPEYTEQRKAYNAELEAARLRDEIRNSSNQLAYSIAMNNWPRVPYYYYHRW